MIRRFSVMLILSLLLAGFFSGTVWADDMPALDLPPGIAAQAEPLLHAMMEHMGQMGMSPEQMQMMMADMQAMADQLPPGIFLQILELMPELDMAEMMSLHQQMHDDGLLQQPPGQVLNVVRRLAR